ncbi:hypothetical protein BH20ACI3_BH20ACI3_13600 [soil metagenome]
MNHLLPMDQPTQHEQKPTALISLAMNLRIECFMLGLSGWNPLATANGSVVECVRN